MLIQGVNPDDVHLVDEKFRQCINGFIQHTYPFDCFYIRCTKKV